MKNIGEIHENIFRSALVNRISPARSWLIMPALFLIVLNTLLGAIEITPSGTSDDSPKIQNALNGMRSGDTIFLKGNFVYRQTIYIPPNIVWILNGKLTLARSPDLDRVGYVAPGIDNRTATGITEKSGGASRIDMSGGIYDAVATESIRLINFVRATDCVFHDMTVQNCSSDNFTLNFGCNGNILRNIIGKASGGNALTDKGKANKWYDCIAEGCKSDGWTPKCQDCEFYRCIARNNDGPGFGLYCRLDGGTNGDQGITISGNKFFACEAYNNTHAGFSANISETSGRGGIIRNNFIQGKFYNNGWQGIVFRNKEPDGIVENNTVDAIIYGNKSLTATGETGAIGGGISVDGLVGISKVKGCAVIYGNVTNDVNFSTAPGCTLTVYHPLDQVAPEIRLATKTVTVVDFSCPAAITGAWCVQTYCGAITAIRNHPEPLLMHRNYPDPSPSTRSFMLNGRSVALRSGFSSIAPAIIITSESGEQGKHSFFSSRQISRSR